MPQEKALTGAAGVHFVVAELSRKDVVALPTIRNTKGVDILASNPDTGESAEIQVKTTAKTGGWMVGRGAEKLKRKKLFYVFVHLLPEGLPEYYIVPSKIVANHIKRAFQIWAEQPAHDKRNPIRKFPSGVIKFDLEKYKNNWKLLGLW